MNTKYVYVLSKELDDYETEIKNLKALVEELIA